MESLQLHLVGCNHRSAPLALRERLSLSPAAQEALYARLRTVEGVAEAMVLHTCNRLEVYAVGDHRAPEALRSALAEVSRSPAEAFIDHGYSLHDLATLRHLYEVAAGLDSQLVGETEIFGQLKEAYNRGCRESTVGRLLHRVLQRSFQAGKWARTHTAIGLGQVSLGNVAVDLAERVYGRLRGTTALVVGTGEIGQDVARALRSRGLGRLVVTSRRVERAAALAAATEGDAISFEDWPAVLERVGVAIFATSAPGALLEVETLRGVMERRRGDPLFLIDLAVPRDIEAACGGLDSVFLYNLEDLTAIANENRRLRESEIEKCRLALAERAEHFWLRLRP